MKTIHFLIILLMGGILFSGCRPESYAPLGDPNDNMTAISGTWKLTKVTQTDAESQRKGFPYTVEDITSLFDYSTLQLTFNLNDGSPATFSIDNGSAPPITGITSGSWSVDDAQAPKVVTLTNGSVSETLTLNTYPNVVNKVMKIRISRYDASDNKLLIVYDYEFSR